MLNNHYKTTELKYLHQLTIIFKKTSHFD